MFLPVSISVVLMIMRNNAYSAYNPLHEFSTVNNFTKEWCISYILAGIFASVTNRIAYSVKSTYTRTLDKT